MNTCIRVILAVIAAWMAAIVWAFMSMNDIDARSLLLAGVEKQSRETMGVLVLAFACGVFPRTIWDLIVAAAKSLPGVAVVLPGLESGQPLSELDGVTIWHESRLEEEDVENIANMATADPLELFLQTRVPPERLMRWDGRGDPAHAPRPRAGEAAG